MTRAFAGALLLFVACSGNVTRERWQHMSVEEKKLYVSSLIGGEKAKDAKGGGAHQYSRPAAEYVTRIDDAYRAGDRRDPAAIFGVMADRR